MSMTTRAMGEAAIWNRVIKPRQDALSPEVARFLLTLTFDEEDIQRMNELAARNQDGSLTAAERKDLECFVKVGDVLSLLHLKGRRSLSR